jgi:diguanylate cyclase (GGDEF)-like protein
LKLAYEADKLKATAGDAEPVAAVPAYKSDGLTGLLPRDAYDAAMGAAFQSTVGADSPLTLLFIDLDRFKEANDADGHPAGDAVLREVASRMRSALDGKGIAYRHGGDEFTAILRNHSLAEGLAVAERIRASIEGVSSGTVAITASIGVATAPDHAGEMDALISAADKAVYLAKDRGRNLVQYFDEPAPVVASPMVRPTRRPPTPGHLSDDDAAAMRREVIHGRRVECPTDHAPLDVIDASDLGSRGKEFIVACPDCGWQQHLHGGRSR